MLSLYRRAFGRARPEEHLTWKLLTRPSDFDRMWVAVLNESGDIVGHYGGIPVRIKLGAQIVEAVHAVEAMTDPEHRRKGMLTALGSAAHAAWSAAGREFVTGLPNDQWGTRNRALGYLPVFPMRWLRFPIQLERALWNKRDVPAVGRVAGYLPLLVASRVWRALTSLRNRTVRNGIVVRPLRSGDEALLNTIWEYASPGWPHIQVRDSDWIAWRYLGAAPEPYHVQIAISAVGGSSRPVGYIAYRVLTHSGRTTGFIADLFVAAGAQGVGWGLIKAALSALSRDGAGTVMTVAPPGSPLYGMFRQCGFIQASAEASFSFELVPLNTALSVDDLSDPADWHLTGGDFDVI